jgi:hypothetical protein
VESLQQHNPYSIIKSRRASASASASGKLNVEYKLHDPETMSNCRFEKKTRMTYRYTGSNHAVFYRFAVFLLAVNAMELVSPQPASAWSTPLTSSANPKITTRDEYEPSFALRDAADAGIHVGPATNPAMGQGAFATKDIPAFTKLGTYTGELLSEEQVLKRYRRGKYRDGEGDKAWERSRQERGQTCTGTYLFNLAGNRGTIDGEDADLAGWCRFMNHATEGGGGGEMECNVKAFDQLEIDGDPTHPTFFTIRDIKAGEELFYDYGSGYGYSDSYQEGTEDAAADSSR